nr:hypothetical protein [Tanacetum cinerariifolium]
MSWFSRCLWCEGPFNGGNCRHCTNLSCSNCGGLFNDGNCPTCSIVGAKNEFVHDPNPFPYDNTPNFYDNNTMSRHTRANYVGTILTMVMIVHHGSRLSMSRNHATIKTLECEIKIDDLKVYFNGMSIEINKKKELRQREQAANLSTYTAEPSRRFNSFCWNQDLDSTR